MVMVLGAERSSLPVIRSLLIVERGWCADSCPFYHPFHCWSAP